MFRAGLYARVSTNDQQTLAMQNRAMREYAGRRGWIIALQVREVGSGATQRQPQPVANAQPDVDCPLIDIRQGASTLTILNVPKLVSPYFFIERCSTVLLRSRVRLAFLQ